MFVETLKQVLCQYKQFYMSYIKRIIDNIFLFLFTPQKLNPKKYNEYV